MNKKIKVYGVPGCPFCKRTKEFLKSKGLNFEDIDVAADHNLAKEMIKKSGQMLARDHENLVLPVRGNLEIKA